MGADRDPLPVSAMNTRWMTLAIFATCFASCDSQSGKSNASHTRVARVFLIEAETCENIGEINVDPLASGNASVKLQPGENTPVLVCEAPPSDRPLNIWLRHRGAVFRMKISTDNKVEEDMSIANQENQFVWSWFGTIEPKVGERTVRFSTKDIEEQIVSIDCILFTEEAVDDKDSLLTPLAPITISESPAKIRDFSHLVRIQTDGLIDSENRKWDEEKARETIRNLIGRYHSGGIVFNIPNWPEWMDADQDGFLDERSKNEYADLAGRFAEIVWEFSEAWERVYFEITDGLDSRYHAKLLAEKKSHRVAELANTYLAACARIRRFAPGIKVGAPSAGVTHNTDFHEQFIAITAPELDFYSVCHQGNADSVATPIREIKDILRRNSIGRDIPLLFRGESGDPTPFDVVRQTWFAHSTFAAGADSVTTWNENEPSSQDFQTLISKFSGACAILKTEDLDLLSAMITEDGGRILFAHRGFRDRTINLPDGKWTGRVLENGRPKPLEIAAEGQVALPGVSLLYLEKSEEP